MLFNANVETDLYYLNYQAFSMDVWDVVTGKHRRERETEMSTTFMMSEYVVKVSENVVNMSENVVKMSENVVELSENVVKMSENVVKIS